LFISDLHLSPEQPRLVEGFKNLLRFYQGKVSQLYILGDWFNAWIGDDNDSPWLDELVASLQKFGQYGGQIYFLPGNRDFALGQAFLNRFGGKLLPEPTVLLAGELRIRLEHGDLLCTDDVKYQRFRRIIRHPLIIAFLKLTPLSFRKKIADLARHKSKQNHATTPSYIMDVNEQAVQQALNGFDILIHGHTHRPAAHDYSNGSRRIVLGDWREYSGEAAIAVLSDEQLHLTHWYF
jgi:UDP-2,3-diacylglucosamine hydrolase